MPVTVNITVTARESSSDWDEIPLWMRFRKEAQDREEQFLREREAKLQANLDQKALKKARDELEKCNKREYDECYRELRADYLAKKHKRVNPPQGWTDRMSYGSEHNWYSGGGYEPPMGGPMPKFQRGMRLYYDD